MKVFFTCTTTQFKKYKQNYLAIRKFLVDEGHVLTRDWIQKVHLNPKSFEDQENGSQEIYKLTIEALLNAEVLIVEDTVEGFSNGHLITLALQRKIPVLVLWHKTKGRYFPKSFIEGVDNPLLQISEYTIKSYKKIIKGFVKKYSQPNDRYHFHLVLDDICKRYIDWAKFNKQKSRTQIIKGAICKMADRDSEYLKYLQE